MTASTMTMGLSGGAMQGIGLGIGAIGDFMGAQAARSAADYNEAAASLEEAQIAVSTRQKQRIMRREGAEQIAKTKVSALKSGVTMEGSPSDVIAMSTENLILDELTLARDAEMSAFSTRERAAAGSRAASSQMGALPAKTATRLLYGMGSYTDKKGS